MADLLNKVGVGLGAVGAGVNAVSGLLGLGADGGQSKFAVSKLVSKLGELNGLQKTSLYLVEMSVPECLSGEYGASDMETMTFLCNMAVLPGRTFAPFLSLTITSSSFTKLTAYFRYLNTCNPFGVHSFIIFGHFIITDWVWFW